MTKLVAGQSVNGPVNQSTTHARLCLSLILLSLTGLLAGCDEPFIVMSGGALSGEVADPPADWTPMNEIDVVQLETNPEDPYSVNVWMIASGPDIYVATGEGDTNWSENIDRNPDVRLRVDGTIYPLEAYRVLDQKEKAAIGAMYVEKYGVDDDDNWIQTGQLFRLDRR